MEENVLGDHVQSWHEPSLEGRQAEAPAGTNNGRDGVVVWGWVADLAGAFDLFLETEWTGIPRRTQR